MDQFLGSGITAVLHCEGGDVVTRHGSSSAVVLDPDDPGAGAPAIVSVNNGEFVSTYWLAINEGELELDGYQLSDKQHDWLLSLESEINLFLF